MASKMAINTFKGFAYGCANKEKDETYTIGTNLRTGNIELKIYKGVSERAKVETMATPDELDKRIRELNGNLKGWGRINYYIYVGKDGQW